MIINIQDDIVKIQALGLLDRMLTDKTTKRNILWATDAYSSLGIKYERNKKITSNLITGSNANVIKTRACKAMEQQTERTKQHAEVFTPLWVCDKMNSYADKACFGEKDIFYREGKPTSRVIFQEEDGWKRYVDSRRLEITCGEAPFLVSRYDVETGEMIPVARRIGILDRKLRVVNENTDTEAEWLRWAKRAFQAVYGYEFQGDNLLIARVNLFMTFEEYMQDRWQRKPTVEEYKKIIKVITWNIWQMDGLTGTVPYRMEEKTYHQTMKFDLIIGNPPYQDETIGDNKGFAPPIYHKFLENAYDIADVVEMIHPARFLFNAGSTPKEWNKRMLEDSHLKVLYYEQDSSKVFANTDIKGGVAITYHDNKKNYGAIRIFTPYPELNGILKKVLNSSEFVNFSDIVITRTAYKLTDKMHEDYPEAIEQLSNGHAYDMSTNIFRRLPQIFYNEKPGDGYDYIQMIGRENNERIYKYVRIDYVNKVRNLDKYKIFLPKANGIGTLGEVLSSPVLAAPMIGATETFLSIGAFDTGAEADAALKYIKTKFTRVLLGTLKTTQDITPDKWKNVPLQDFTVSSDIDWSKSVKEIDSQLYAKYGLDTQEIDFIESHVKEME